MVALMVVVIPMQSSATPSVISTGIYGNWLIGYNPAAHTVTGYFSSGDGSAKDSTCEFYFVGDLVSVRGQIKAFVPDRPESTHSGLLTTHLPGSITIEFEHDLCRGMAKAIDLSITRFYRWKEVRVTKSPNTQLFDAPDSRNALHRKLGLGDAVGVKESDRGWLRVDNLTSQGGASGWAHEDDFYPVQNQQKTSGGNVANRSGKK